MGSSVSRTIGLEKLDAGFKFQLWQVLAVSVSFTHYS